MSRTRAHQTDRPAGTRGRPGARPRGRVAALLAVLVATLLPALPAGAAALTGVSIVYAHQMASPTGTRVTITFTAGTDSAAAKQITFAVPPGTVLATNATFDVTPDGGVAFDETGGNTIQLASNTVTITHNATFTLNTGGASTVTIDGLLLTAAGTWGNTGTGLALTTISDMPAIIDGPTDSADDVTIAAAAAGATAAVATAGTADANEINSATVGAVTVTASQTANWANAMDRVFAVLYRAGGSAVHGSATTLDTGTNTTAVPGVDASALTDGPVTVYTFALPNGGNFTAATTGTAAVKDVVVPAITGIETSAGDADVVAVTYDDTLDCGKVAAWSAAQFTYDLDGNAGSEDVAATALACAGSVLSVTFPGFTVFDTAAADRLRYTQSGTAAQRVADDVGNPPATGSSTAVADGTGPMLFSATLSIDGDGSGAWDAVDDVLTLSWNEAATLAAGVIDNLGYEDAEEAELEALLGVGAGALDLAGTTVVVVDGSGSATWTLRITGAPLTVGLTANTATNGSSNADVTDGAANTQIPGTNVTLRGGSWFPCGTTYAGVTVNDRCIVADGFQTSTDGVVWATVNPTDGGLDLDVFDTGLLQIQVVDDDRLGGSPDQYELVGGGGAKLTAAHRVRIELNVGSLDPVVLIGTGEMIDYTTTPGADNLVEIVAEPSNTSRRMSGPCLIADAGGCGDDSTAADRDYVGMLSFAMDQLAGAPAFADAARGTWILTDAQAFAAPTWNPVDEAFQIDVAAPHLTQAGPVNTGEFTAFLPDGLFGPDFFGVSPASAVFDVTADGSAVTASSTIVTGGVLLELTGYSYSAPEIAITATAAPITGGGGGGSTGGTTTTAPVTGGGTVRTGQGTTPLAPTQTAVTSPVAGSVTIEQRQTTTTLLPSGVTAIEIEVDISAPAATPDEPLALDFELDASLLDDVDIDRLVVFRNGQAVPACTHATAAAPDPCLASRSLQDDLGLALTVRTSQASVWNVAEVDVACLEGLVPAGGFADVAADGAHRASIDCASWWGLVDGTAPGTYEPSTTVTRAQAAALVHRLLVAIGVALPAAGDRFADATGVHSGAIEALAAAGVVDGLTATTYGPGRSVTRAQLAKLLVEAYEYATGKELETPATDTFTDDDASVLESRIEQAAAAGFTGGITATTFEPNRSATRAQVASMLVNVLGRLVDEGVADPPL